MSEDAPVITDEVIKTPQEQPDVPVVIDPQAAEIEEAQRPFIATAAKIAEASIGYGHSDSRKEAYQKAQQLSERFAKNAANADVRNLKKI